MNPRAQHIMDLIAKFKFLDWRFRTRYDLQAMAVFLRLERVLPDSKTGETVWVMNDVMFPVDKPLDDEWIIDQIHWLIIGCVTHEVDELLEFDGERRWYPHSQTDGEVVRSMMMKKMKEKMRGKT